MSELVVEISIISSLQAGGGGEVILGRSQQIIETHFTLNMLPPAAAQTNTENIVLRVGN